MDRIFVFCGIAHAEAVVGVGTQGVRAACDDDVYAFHQWCELFFKSQLLQVGHQDDLVDALGAQRIYDRLDNGSQVGHVVGSGTRVEHLGVAWGGYLGQTGGGSAHQTYFFAVAGDDRGTRKTFFLAVGCNGGRRAEVAGLAAVGCYQVR